MVIGVQLDCVTDAVRALGTVVLSPGLWCATTSAATMMPVTIAASTVIQRPAVGALRRRIAILPLRETLQRVARWQVMGTPR